MSSGSAVSIWWAGCSVEWVHHAFPFPDDESDGSRETLTAETLFLGDLLDGVVITLFQVDDALDVDWMGFWTDWHGWTP